MTVSIEFPYWGGYTDRGVVLHLAAKSEGGFAVAACGRLLDGGSWEVPAGKACFFRQCARCLKTLHEGVAA